MIEKWRSAMLSNAGELNLRAKRFLLRVTVISIASRQLWRSLHSITLCWRIFYNLWRPFLSSSHGKAISFFKNNIMIKNAKRTLPLITALTFLPALLLWRFIRLRASPSISLASRNLRANLTLNYNIKIHACFSDRRTCNLYCAVASKLA